MAPIYDTDIAEERWSKDEWKQYELWERVELRLRRRKHLWIAGTVLVFLFLSSIPILTDRWPKWASYAASRKLAQEIGRMKTDAALRGTSFRIRFAEDGRLAYTVEELKACTETTPLSGRNGSLISESKMDRFALLGPEQATELGIPGLAREFCYDSHGGSGVESMVGFGIIPAKDLTDRRADRLSVLLLSGPSAEISFD